MGTEKDIKEKAEALAVQAAQVKTALSDLTREVGETKTAIENLRDQIKTGMTQEEVDSVLSTLDKASSDLSTSISDAASSITGLDTLQQEPPATP